MAIFAYFWTSSIELLDQIDSKIGLPFALRAINCTIVPYFGEAVRL
jgi:hypothetical protein